VLASSGERHEGDMRGLFKRVEKTVEVGHDSKIGAVRRFLMIHRKDDSLVESYAGEGQDLFRDEAYVRLHSLEDCGRE
jgi:hypothetical protein